MSATIIVFPGPAPTSRSTVSIAAHLAPMCADALARKFTDHFLPVVQIGVELMEADEVDLEARCRLTLDVDGVALIDELCAEMTNVERQMRLLADGLDLTRARLRTAVARLADTQSPERAG